MAPNDQAQDYESELAAARQQERLQQMQAEQEAQKPSRLQRLKGNVAQLAKQQAKNMAKQAAKQVAKQAIRPVAIWVATGIAALLGNPITWFVSFALLIIVFGYWCVQPATNIPNCAGIVGWGIVDIFKVVF
ncbi:MAG: hypothetical protein WC621_00600 [Patescibacteria group bacterium]